MTMGCHEFGHEISFGLDPIMSGITPESRACPPFSALTLAISQSHHLAPSTKSTSPTMRRETSDRLEKLTLRSPAVDGLQAQPRCTSRKDSTRAARQLSGVLPIDHRLLEPAYHSYDR